MERNSIASPSRGGMQADQYAGAFILGVIGALVAFLVITVLLAGTLAVFLLSPTSFLDPATCSEAGVRLRRRKPTCHPLKAGA